MRKPPSIRRGCSRVHRRDWTARTIPLSLGRSVGRFGCNRGYGRDRNCILLPAALHQRVPRPHFPRRPVHNHSPIIVGPVIKGQYKLIGKFSVPDIKRVAVICSQNHCDPISTVPVLPYGCIGNRKHIPCPFYGAAAHTSQHAVRVFPVLLTEIKISTG